MKNEAEINSLEHEITLLLHDAEVTPAEAYMICEVVKAAYSGEVFALDVQQRFGLKEK